MADATRKETDCLWWQHRYGKLVQSQGGSIVPGFEHACIGKSEDLPREVSRACHPRETGIGSSDQTSWDDYGWKEAAGGLVVRPVFAGDKAYVVSGRIRSDIEDPIRRRRYTLAHYLATEAAGGVGLPSYDLAARLIATPLTALDPKLPRLKLEVDDRALPPDWLNQIWPLLEVLMCGETVAVIDGEMSPDQFFNERVRLVQACVPGVLRWRIPAAGGCFVVNGEQVALGHGMRANTTVQWIAGEWRGREKLTADALKEAAAYRGWLQSVTTDVSTLAALAARVDRELKHLAAWNANEPESSGFRTWKAVLADVHAAVADRMLLQDWRQYLYQPDSLPLDAPRAFAKPRYPTDAKLTDQLLELILQLYDESPAVNRRVAAELPGLREARWDAAWGKWLKQRTPSPKIELLRMVLDKTPLSVQTLARHGATLSAELAAFAVLAAERAFANWAQSTAGRQQLDPRSAVASDPTYAAWRSIVLQAVGAAGKPTDRRASTWMSLWEQQRLRSLAWAMYRFLKADRLRHHYNPADMSFSDWSSATNPVCAILFDVRMRQPVASRQLAELLRIVEPDGQAKAAEVERECGDAVRSLAQNLQDNGEYAIAILLLEQLSTGSWSQVRELREGEKKLNAALRSVAARYDSLADLPQATALLKFLLTHWEAWSAASDEKLQLADRLATDIGPVLTYVYTGVRLPSSRQMPRQAACRAARNLLGSALANPRTLTRVLEFVRNPPPQHILSIAGLSLEDERAEFKRQIEGWIATQDSFTLTSRSNGLAALVDYRRQRVLDLGKKLEEDDLEILLAFEPPPLTVAPLSRISSMSQLVAFLRLAPSDATLPPDISPQTFVDLLPRLASLANNSVDDPLWRAFKKRSDLNQPCWRLLRSAPEETKSGWLGRFSPFKKSIYSPAEEEIWIKLPPAGRLRLILDKWPLPERLDYPHDRARTFNLASLIETAAGWEDVRRLIALAENKQWPELADACLRWLAAYARQRQSSELDGDRLRFSLRSSLTRNVPELLRFAIESASVIENAQGGRRWLDDLIKELWPEPANRNYYSRNTDSWSQPSQFPPNQPPPPPANAATEPPIMLQSAETPSSPQEEEHPSSVLRMPPADGAPDAGQTGTQGPSPADDANRPGPWEPRRRS